MSRSSASRPVYVIGPRQTGAPVPMSGFGSAAPELGSPYASLNSSQSRRSTNDASDSSPGLPGRLLDVEDAVGHELEPAEALEHVRPPGPVVVAVAHRVAELAVVDEVDPELALLGDDVRDRLGELGLVARLVVELAQAALQVERDELLRPRQAARVAGQDPIRHRCSPPG